MTSGQLFLFIVLGVGCGLLIFSPRIKAWIKAAREKAKKKNESNKDDIDHTTEKKD